MGIFQKDRAAIVSWNLGEDSAQVSDYLSEEYDILPPASWRSLCSFDMRRLKTVEQGAVRVQFSHFNTEEQIDAVIDALEAFLNEEQAARYAETEFLFKADVALLVWVCSTIWVVSGRFIQSTAIIWDTVFVRVRADPVSDLFVQAGAHPVKTLLCSCRFCIFLYCDHLRYNNTHEIFPCSAYVYLEIYRLAYTN